jgi:hypothetical protein
VEPTNPLLGPIITASAAFGGVLLGTIFVPWLRHRAERKRRARYLAIRVVCTLDEFVATCAAVAGDSGEEDEQGFFYPVHKIPSPPVYPTDVDWYSIEPSLLYDLLSLPSAAEQAHEYVRGSSEHDDPPEYQQYFEARCEAYGQLALTAHKYTETLRKKYAIPVRPNPPSQDWNPVEYAQEHLDKLKATRERRAALYAKHAADL